MPEVNLYRAVSRALLVTMELETKAKVGARDGLEDKVLGT